MLDWTVSPQESGIKLIVFLTKHLDPQHSSRFIKRMIEQNHCSVNGKIERFASYIVGKGDQISFRLGMTALPSASPIHTVDPLRILFEDEWLFIYNKPSGINSDEKGIVHLLKLAYSPLYLVHRLDRKTTGVLVLAKQSSTFNDLVTQFKHHQVQKKYLAIVDGCLDKPFGLVENHLAKKQAFAGQTLWGSVPASQGVYASTEWQRLKIGNKVSLVACVPKTGRTHQIRVHMAELGHPILGDHQYARKFQSSYHSSRYLLHAQSISFSHPITKKSLSVEAPLPEDFKRAQQELFRG